jgi:hypothetical protein
MSNKIDMLKFKQNFLDKLKEQIKTRNVKEQNYVLLKLNESDGNMLSEYLQHKKIISYILLTYNALKSPFHITDDKEEWYICITGYLAGAKKNSPKKIGLLAYKKVGKGYGHGLIKTKKFFCQTDIGISSNPYNKSIRDGIIDGVIYNINEYLGDNKPNENNYIKYN